MEIRMPRSPTSAVLWGLVLLALGGCAQRQAAVPALPPVATSAPLTGDQNFVDRAALGTSSEIQLGRLARTRALSPAVRSFAARIITDHRQAHARLKMIERHLQMAPTTAPAPQSQLAAQFGADFDRQFMADQIQNHQEAIQLFQAEAQAGQDPRLRKYASDNLPILYRDLQEAQAIAARLGS
jgi:putative membrane protein